MDATIRDSSLGQLIRFATKNRVLKYPEEVEGFTCPNGYTGEKPSLTVDSSASTQAAISPAEEKDIENLPISTPTLEHHNALANTTTAPDRESISSSEDGVERNLSKIVSRADMTQVNTRHDLEQAYSRATLQESMKQQPSRPIAPTKTSDGTILVDWYTTDDPANPQ